jgi:hypothetical protein
MCSTGSSGADVRVAERLRVLPSFGSTEAEQKTGSFSVNQFPDELFDIVRHQGPPPLAIAVVNTCE